MLPLDKKTVVVFFDLLRAGLWGDVKANGYRLKVKDSAIDWGEVYRLAEEQSVIGLVAAGIENLNANLNLKVPQEWALQFIGQTLQIEQRNKAMNAFVAELVEKLRNADIYKLLVKGQGIAQYYEKPLWRACGDVDLFLSEENYIKARDFLTPIASSVEKEEHYKKHIGLTIDGWVVELHGNLYSSLSRKVERELDAISENTFKGGVVRSGNIEGAQVFMLGNENNVFYVFTHILQHYFHGGIGLRQICDWCRLLWAFRNQLDLTVLKNRIERAGLMSEWKAFGTFAIEDLGMPKEAMPFVNESENEKLKKKAEGILDYLLESGNFGHRDLSYVRESGYISRKVRSFKSTVSEMLTHIRTFPLDSIRFFVYYTSIRMKALLRGE